MRHRTVREPSQPRASPLPSSPISTPHLLLALPSGPLALPLRRLSDALLSTVSASGWAVALALLGVYAALVLPAGIRSGFLPARPQPLSPGPLLRLAARLLLMPALGEELLFRVALLPHPSERASLASLLGWGLLSTGLFVIYHPLAGASWYPAGRRVFRDPRFLLPCTLLGIVCALTYGISGTLWPPVLIHWIVVVLWLGVLGGRRQLES